MGILNNAKIILVCNFFSGHVLSFLLGTCKSRITGSIGNSVFNILKFISFIDLLKQLTFGFLIILSCFPVFCLTDFSFDFYHFLSLVYFVVLFLVS